MKNTSIFCASLFLILTTAQAQQVSYKITEDQPKLPGVQAWFIPFYAEAFGVNTTLGYGIGGRYNHGKRLAAEFQLHAPYSDRMDSRKHDAGNVHNRETNTIKRSRFFQVGGTYALKAKNKTKSLRVNLRSSRSGTYSGGYSTTTTYINVKGTAFKKTALRGGLFAYRSALTTNQLPNEYAESTDSSRFTVFAYIAPDGNDVYQGSKTLDWGTHMSVSGFYGGFSFQSITGLSVNAQGYGIKHNKKQTDFYIDFLYAPVVSIDDINYNDTTYTIVGNGENQFSKKRMGFRTGFEWNFVRTSFSFGFKTEFGVRPGVKGKGTFFNLYYYFPLLNFMKDHNV